MPFKVDHDRAVNALIEHTIWFASGGRSGTRADVANCDLTCLTADDMAGQTWEGAYCDCNTIWPKD